MQAQATYNYAVVRQFALMTVLPYGLSFAERRYATPRWGPTNKGLRGGCDAGD